MATPTAFVRVKVSDKSTVFVPFRPREDTVAKVTADALRAAGFVAPRADVAAEDGAAPPAADATANDTGVTTSPMHVALQRVVLCFSQLTTPPATAVGERQRPVIIETPLPAEALMRDTGVESSQMLHLRLKPTAHTGADGAAAVGEAASPAFATPEALVLTQ